jgi:uncharacterized protein (DUF427 family)
MHGTGKDLKQARKRWRYRGNNRPDFALPVNPSQESVWDYPRPPRVEPDSRIVRVVFNDETIAETDRAIRVLETASPPTFYLPPKHVDTTCLRSEALTSLCEWKGRAQYFSVIVDGSVISMAAWSYPEPFEGYEMIADHFSFYPAKVECYVADERVRPQPGGYYGGWVTDEIVGPFKGEAGRETW